MCGEGAGGDWHNLDGLQDRLISNDDASYNLRTGCKWVCACTHVCVCVCACAIVWHMRNGVLVVVFFISLHEAEVMPAAAASFH